MTKNTLTNYTEKTYLSSDGESYNFSTNHLSSTTLVTDEEDLVVSDRETPPFEDQEDKSIFYTGKQWDEDAQLYYFNARWYDPETGRFITEDPIKDGLLWFAYVNNNPMGFVDPTGMLTIDANGNLVGENGGSNPEMSTTGLNNSQSPILEPDLHDRKANRQAKIPSIIERFPYMEGYYLTENEVNQYFELIQKEQELEAEIEMLTNSGQIDKVNDVIKEFDKYFLGILHQQSDLTPNGENACDYRSIQSIIEFNLRSPLPLSIINEMTENLAGNNLNMSKHPKNGSPTYGTEMFWDIANKTLAAVGRDDLHAYWGHNDNSLFNGSVERGDSNGIPHWIATGLGSGNLYFDPKRTVTAIDLSLDDPFDNHQFFNVR